MSFALCTCIVGALVAGCPEGRSCARLEGSVVRGADYQEAFGPGLTFALEPIERGWVIVVRDDRESENIARLTPPFHGVLNPRYVEGWHFRNLANTGPNDGSERAPHPLAAQTEADGTTPGGGVR